MSRTPVREAFLLLEGEGLLRLFPKRGALVLAVAAGEVEAVIEAREVVETAAAAKLARLDPAARREAIARLEASLEEQRRLIASGDRKGAIAADRDFHSLLVASSGNPIIEGFYATLRDRQLRILHASLVDVAGRAEEILSEHQRLIELVAAGDGAAARRLVHRHLAATRAAVAGQRFPGARR